MNEVRPALERERPSFEELTLSKLAEWKVTRIYGLTQEEVKDLITTPDTDTPSHHQVDPRIIKAYLMGEIIPTYLPGHRPWRYQGILPSYLPRDRFLYSELIVPLVDAQYRRHYRIWKGRLDANTDAIDLLIDYFEDPSVGIPNYPVLEAPVLIPSVPTIAAAELQWWNGYFSTYHSFDDILLLEGHYRNTLSIATKTVSWHTGKSAQDIYALALAIFQVGLQTIDLTSKPDFTSLSQEEKDRIYQDLHYQIDRLNLRR